MANRKAVVSPKRIQPFNASSEPIILSPRRQIKIHMAVTRHSIHRIEHCFYWQPVPAREWPRPFNAPIAGAIFVLEELTGSFEIAITATTLGASASAICVSRVFLGQSPDFQVPTLGFLNFGLFSVSLVIGMLMGLLGVVGCIMPLLIGAAALLTQDILFCGSRSHHRHYPPCRTHRQLLSVPAHAWRHFRRHRHSVILKGTAHL